MPFRWHSFSLFPKQRMWTYPFVSLNRIFWLVAPLSRIAPYSQIRYFFWRASFSTWFECYVGRIVVLRQITPAQGKATATVSNQCVRNPPTLAAEHVLASFWMAGQSEVSFLLRCSWFSGTERKNDVSLLSLHTKPTPAFLSRLLSSFPHWLGRELGSDSYISTARAVSRSE